MKRYQSYSYNIKRYSSAEHRDKTSTYRYQSFSFNKKRYQSYSFNKEIPELQL